jgi:hypothetical protein
MSPEDEASRKRARRHSGARRWCIEGVHEAQPELF